MEKLRVIDLTQPIEPGMPIWPGDPAVEYMPWCSLEQHGFNLQRISLGEHSGTHLGAPRHFSASGCSIEEIPLTRLMTLGIKIVLPQDESSAGIASISRWEKRHGPVPADSWVLFETGWSRHWQDPNAYHTAFPGVAEEAVRFLCRERSIAGIGIDSPDVDGGASSDFAANRILAEHGGLHLENLCRLEQLPPAGFQLFIGALPLVGATGSPCRVLALMPSL
ncbi:MAG TPA: cyclase family protein [bacterium]|nr:cyclase family protein [bacterium]